MRETSQSDSPLGAKVRGECFGPSACARITIVIAIRVSLVVTPLLKAEAAFPVRVHEKRRRPKEGNQSWHFQIESRSSPSRGSSAGLARDPV